jgi:YegS/Rv2252/BmrU family lipid kinase
VSHPLGRPLLIANPAAGLARGTTLTQLRTALLERGVEHDVAVTARPGHAKELARRAVEDEGRTYLVAVGGDGTVHEVVNGLIDAETGQVRGDDPVLGVVGNGSGCDLVRTFGLDRSAEVLAGHLATDATVHLDIGRIAHRDPQGQPVTTLFANIAEAGFGASVVATAARLPRRLGAGRDAPAIVVAWGRFRRVRTRVAVDGGERTDELCNVVVANGQFFGGGMHVAPRALPTDGRFNVQAWGGTPTDVLRAGRLVRTGQHLSRPDVREWQSKVVEVDPERPLLIEADGEVLGSTPARFDVLASALRFKL